MPFDSNRKRMSVLVKDPYDGKIKLFIKGADSIIKERLRKDSDPNHKKIQKSVDEFIE